MLRPEKYEFILVFLCCSEFTELAITQCVHTLGNDEVGPKDGVTSVAFSPDGRLVAAGSLDKIVRIWDAETGYFLDRFEGHTDSVYR